MHQTHVVRHGQASARSRDYDVLSPLGVQQARRLGEHFARHGVGFDGVFSGPRRRQLDTARHLVEAARAGGAALPEAVELDSGDEIPLGAILALWLPARLDHDPVARAIVEHRYDLHSDEEIRALLGGAMQAWAAGEVAAPSLPTFAGFVARIDEALAEVRSHGGATLFVTSAGPMAASLHLGGHDGARTPAEVMGLAVRVPNAARTILAHDGQRLAVAEVNDVSHLAVDERTLM